MRHNPFLLGRKQFGKRTEIDRAVHVALDPGVPQHIPRRTARPEFHSDSIDRELAQDHTCGIGTGRMVKQRRIEQQIIDPRPTPPITEVTAVHFAIEPDTRQYTAVETVRSRYLRLQVSRQVGLTRCTAGINSTGIRPNACLNRNGLTRQVISDTILSAATVTLPSNTAGISSTLKAS